MRCDCCPLTEYGEPCGAFDDIGVVFPDGTIGCYTPANKIKRLDDERNEYYGTMGTDMGQEMHAQYCGVEISDIVAVCEHMIGLDYQNPYHRHGKAFYKPYRNYYDAPPDGDKRLDAMLSHLISKSQKSPESGVMYKLTRQGMDWLGRMLGIVIYDERAVICLIR